MTLHSNIVTPNIITIACFATIALACSKHNDRSASSANNAPSQYGAQNEYSERQASERNRSSEMEGQPTENRSGPNSTAQNSTAARETRSAASSLTQSRCMREQRCNNIGSGKKYSSFGDCEAVIGNDWRDDLNARECSGGVDQQQLDECMTRIKNEDCGNPFESLARIAACTQSQICEHR
ncbi:MAG TPA: DUF6184 family natural product biosynthesis lipoprotein [Polyangiaceae bacterium]|jgi:hypothetical protein|nr:DUF6184 family natural product biosynthesis lipoprotein [Polyangiaceae bacterium]